MALLLLPLVVAHAVLALPAPASGPSGQQPRSPQASTRNIVEDVVTEPVFHGKAYVYEAGRANPYTDPDAAVKRRNYVIERMVANGYVTKADGDKALAEPLKVVNRLDTDENQAAAFYVEELRKDILALGEEKKLAGFNSREEIGRAHV